MAQTILKAKAEKGDTASIYLLANGYWNGTDGLPKSLSKAAFLYKKGALLGHAPCALKYFTYCRNFSKDIHDGMKYLAMAAESGHPESEYVLGMAYWEDDLVTKDLMKAEQWIQKSIDDGCTRALRKNSRGETPIEEVRFELQKEIQKMTGLKRTVENDHNQKKSYVDSDVDKNIYSTSDSNDKTFAIVIANENYENVSNVPFAYHDGESVLKYLHLTLGIPETNIRFVRDATRNDMRFHVNWAKQMMKSYNGEAKLILYYAGHGIPDEVTKDAYLLPVDGTGRDVTSAFSLKDLYDLLNQLPSRATIVLLDACFSGATRDGDVMEKARGVAIRAKESEPIGSLVVLSAATGDQTAAPYQSNNHGMFTYFLLKKIQESKGEATIGELSDYIIKQVKRASLIENGKLQTPTVNASSSVSDWQEWKLK